MTRRRKSAFTISAEQARQALTFLLDQGKVAASEVQKAVERREHLVRDLKSRLAALGEATGRAISLAAKDGPFPMLRASRTRKVKRKPKRRVSAARRRSMQQQGRYLAAIRQLSVGDRKKIKAVREKSGVNAAIAAAKRVTRD
jgi:hypothetical protein